MFSAASVALLLLIVLPCSLFLLTADAINLKNLVFNNREEKEERPNDNINGELMMIDSSSDVDDEHHRNLIHAALGTHYKDGSTNKNNYGLDVSYPAQHSQVSDPKRQLFYESILQSCRSSHSLEKKDCDESERNRIHRNYAQPPLMTKNFSYIGFQTDQLPQYLIDELTEFWDDQYYSSLSSPAEEHWHGLENTYTNHWQSPTYMLSLEKDSYLRAALSHTVEQKLYEWIATFPQQQQEEEDMELVLTSFYSVRIYKEHSIVAPHVDRLPFVLSAMIQVAQENDDDDDDWPLELYGHDGKAYNISLRKPGDMILYEGHSIIHGRPFPFQGKHSANIVLHFEPKGYTQRFYESFASNHNDHDKESKNIKNDYYSTLKEQQQNQQQQQQKHKIIPKQQQDNSLPLYLHKGGIEELLWNPGRTTSKRKIKISVDTTTSSVSPLSIHQISARGDLNALDALVSINPDVIHEKDKNGWQPIHEAARGGHTEMIKYLLDNGVDINARTNGGIGGTPLYWAKKKHGKAHKSVKLLESRGALEIDPEL